MITSGVYPRSVFVIHGRNEAARKGLFEYLRAIGLLPIEWSEALAMTGSASPYIGDVLDAAFERAQAVIVLQTPDDVAHLHESLTYPGDPETAPQMQPRPNVLFEAGMAMGRNPDRTLIVELGQVKVFSDIHGRHSVRLDNSVAKRQDLANRLLTAGCDVRMQGTDWHEAGDLTPPGPPGNGLPLGRKLPSSETAGLPRLSARLFERGGNKFADVIVTNQGPGSVYGLTAAASEDDDTLRTSDELPVPELPVGKSVRVLQRLPASFSQVQRSYFTVTLRARTADGVPIEQDEFVSGD
ncbi:nucleotide-binding protein [Frigoribacterium sp. ACAM 257]|uniref:TIR domain-containing protein n=1 Tax=Frigoribacterium sp. ACAM 257 TaxID=2508998 RepID=UPI0011B98E3E|nr:nucleotide-binding protein [Frigoribacterium sp. ACAM 257]TWX37394.1 nucleotide-binding protein [Frigoribacterium sp. ACAM 257]